MNVSRRSALLAAALCAVLAAPPAHALKVATWNLTIYPTDSLALRQPKFRTVIAGLDPDIIMVQELVDGFGNAPRDTFMNVLRAALPNRHWGVNSYIASTESCIYWDSLKVDVSSFSGISTGGPRKVLVGLAKPLGYASKSAWFRLYSIHLKAGNTPSDADTRATECTNLRNNINSVSLSAVGPNFLVGGDSNFQGATEQGYLRLTESQTGTNGNNGRGLDPLNMPGTWHLIQSYGPYMTQCPCNTGCLSFFSGGGLDDRFDLILSSYSGQDGQGLDLVPSTGYGAYGNDGFHFNSDVNGGGVNATVGITIANALHDASDHLPVFFTLQLPSKVVAASALDFGSVLVGATAQQTLEVSDGATPPADGLTYSLTAPAGFSAPSGTFEAAAGALANDHVLGMDTSTRGTRAGSLTIASDAPDSLSKGVLLSGTVLAHAVPSLDSLIVTTADTLDLGAHQGGLFVDGPVRVFDQGYDALTARLSVSGAVITGGDGHFSLVGGFTPTLLGAVGQTWNVHFDDTAPLTLDSTYSATLTFTDADEALPGAAAAPPLTVTLLARPLTGSGGVSQQPLALRFVPARPNPFSHETRFAFELPQAAPVTLEVFDLSGRRVAMLAQGGFEAGRHDARWDGTDGSGARAPAGLYFARFSTPGLTRTTRMALLP